MFRLLETETKPVTRELATEFRDMEASPTERDLDLRRVAHLKDKAVAGLLVSFQWATAQLGNRRLRMNGRHSSTMLTELDGSFPDNLVAHIDNYDVGDEDGLALLFRQFDDRKSARSPADVAGAYQGLYAPLHEVPKKIAKLGVLGVAWWRRTVEKVPTPSNDDVYSLMGETGLHSFLRWLPEIFNIKTREMQVEAVLGAMYATYIASEHGANEFWMSVSRNGILYDETAPATVLDEWLKSIQDKDAPNAQILGNLTASNKYQGCIYAWNAYRKNQSLSEIRFNTGKGFYNVVA
jgi:hypothetical protein